MSTYRRNYDRDRWEEIQRIDFNAPENAPTLGFLCKQFASDNSIRICLLLGLSNELVEVRSEADVRNAIYVYSAWQVRVAIHASMQEIRALDE